MKRESTEWENIFANDTSDKRWISKIHKGLIQLNTKKTNKPPPKNRQRSWIDTSPKRTYRCPIDMKNCSMSVIIREMQIKTTMRYHLMPVRMAIINKSTNKCWWGWGEKGTLMHCWWECRLVQPLWKTIWSFLKKSKMDLPFDPDIPLLGIYPKIPKHQFKRIIQHNVHCGII